MTNEIYVVLLELFEHITYFYFRNLAGGPRP
jgi:hypothetical protein